MTQLGDSRVTIATADDANPYPILGIADAVIVTSDSVNMASEAALTGKPLLIAAWQPETGRIAAFHQAMAVPATARRLAPTAHSRIYPPSGDARHCRQRQRHAGRRPSLNEEMLTTLTTPSMVQLTRVIREHAVIKSRYLGRIAIEFLGRRHLVTAKHPLGGL